ncbi:MAG: c-type cytochrome, partial [Bradymonadia bacterium]
MKKLVVSTLCLALMFGCGGDDNTEEQPGGTAGEAGAGGAAGEAGAGGAAGEAGAGGTAGEAGAGGAAGEAGAGGTAGEAGAGGTAGEAGAGGAAGEAGAGGAAGQAEAQVERGRYLVHHVADCVGCHTPRTPMGQLDETKTLAGVTCFIDVDPANDEFGCLNTRNLTNDATGLANRSDEEIRDMLIQGVRPDGTFLHPMMPYWMYTNMETGDLDAIIAYLRTVPGIENRVGNSQAPFDSVGGTVMPLDLDLVPSPAPENEHYESAMRGRYLAVNVG